MPSRPLTPEQETRAQELAQAIRAAAEDEILQIARTLAATDDRHLFGNTEFRIRDLVHKIGAKAYAAHLAEKKLQRQTCLKSMFFPVFLRPMLCVFLGEQALFTGMTAEFRQDCRCRKKLQRQTCLK